MNPCNRCPVVKICAERYFKKPCPIPYDEPPKKEEKRNEEI